MSKRKTKEKSYNFWDRVSRFSKYVDDLESPLDICLQSKFGTYLMPQDTVLDFGCGAGSTTFRIARHTHKVYGVDVSDGMLKKAEDTLKVLDLDNISFHKIGTPEDIKPSKTSNVVTTFAVLQYIGDRKQIFECFHKLLIPKGLLIISIPFLGDKKTFISRLIRLLRFLRLMPKTYFLHQNDFKDEITSSGFTIIEDINISDLPEHFIVARKT